MNNISEIFFDQGLDVIESRETLEKRFAAWKKKQHGFFTPYRSKDDFLVTLASPITTPVQLGLFTGLFIASTAWTTLLSAGSLLVGSAAWALKDTETKTSCFEMACKGIMLTALWGTISALLAVAAVLSVIACPIRLVTRSVASIAAASGCIDDKIEKEIVEDENAYDGAIYQP